MSLLTCSACDGTGWANNDSTPLAMCHQCAGLGFALGPEQEDLTQLPRWSPMQARRWRRGARLDNGDWEWIASRDYADASVCYLMEEHHLLPGWQIEIAAYDPDPASDLYSDDVRPLLERKEDGYLWLYDSFALAKQRGVLEWHRSRGLGMERYFVQLAEEGFDGVMIVSFEVWDVQYHEHPFPEVESANDELPDVA